MATHASKAQQRTSSIRVRRALGGAGAGAYAVLLDAQAINARLICHKKAEEIIGSDSSAGISILKRNGSSRRTKHVELKVFFLQAYYQLDYVKIMKCNLQI